MKYITRIGQNTGMLKTWKKVQQKAITWNKPSSIMLPVIYESNMIMMIVTVALVAEYQNLNSGKRLERIWWSFNWVQKLKILVNVLKEYGEVSI